MLALGCNSAPIEVSEPDFPEAAQQKAQAKAAQEAERAQLPRAAAVAPALQEFAVSARSRQLVAGAAHLKRRTPGYRFTQTHVPSLKFVEHDKPALSARLKQVTQRFLAASLREPAASAAVAAVVEADALLQVKAPAPGVVAYAVPESGAFTLVRDLPALKETPLKDSSAAVSAALDAITDNDWLQLGKHEALDLAGVTTQYQGATSEQGTQPATRTAYRVMFGRTVAGIPVLGPPFEVTLDSDGKVAGVRKGWRDLAEPAGTIELADESEVASRRDPLMVEHLSEESLSCGYAEDTNPSAKQVAPGVACHYRYNNPKAANPLNRLQDDWVNVAKTPELKPLRGVSAAGLNLKESQ
jgi:hypothetical protein